MSGKKQNETNWSRKLVTLATSTGLTMTAESTAAPAAAKALPPKPNSKSDGTDLIILS